MSQVDGDSVRDDQDFATLWEQMGGDYAYLNPTRGDIRQGVILSVRPDEVLVDIGAKQDASVALRELQTMDADEWQQFVVGRVVDVYVLRFDPDQDSLIVSLRLARENQEWQRLQEMMDSGEILTARVTGYNKGGLVCAVGNLQGFVPASQLANLARRNRDESESDALPQYVGEELPLKVIEVNRRRRRLILSERAAVREWRVKQRERLLSELRVGGIYTGRVSNLCDFGAFVDLGGIDGLVHLSELSWSRVNHPAEALRVGQEVQVLVLNMDLERQRVGLSIKRTQADPWLTASERYPVGRLVTGVVTHMVDFGVFVALEPGIEGLVHTSELAAGNIANPASVVSEGQELTLLVLSVEPERRRVSLSLRQVPSEAEAEAELPS